MFLPAEIPILYLSFTWQKYVCYEVKNQNAQIKFELKIGKCVSSTEILRKWRRIISSVIILIWQSGKTRNIILNSCGTPQSSNRSQIGINTTSVRWGKQQFHSIGAITKSTWNSCFSSSPLLLVSLDSAALPFVPRMVTVTKAFATELPWQNITPKVEAVSISSFVSNEQIVIDFVFSLIRLPFLSWRFLLNIWAKELLQRYYDSQKPLIFFIL